MNHIYTSACILMLLTAAVSGQPVIDIPEMPYDQYHALRTRDLNSQKLLPKLDYWGASGFEWETDDAIVQQAARGPAAATQFGGLPCRQECRSEMKSKKLNCIRYTFASGITNRQERLRQYHLLKTELTKAYRSPTHQIKEDDVLRGQDAYVQGLDREYRLEWHGPETIVCLTLSDDSLSLEFRQAPTSQAAEKKERVKRAKETEQRIREKLEQASRLPLGATTHK